MKNDLETSALIIISLAVAITPSSPTFHIFANANNIDKRKNYVIEKETNIIFDNLINNDNANDTNETNNITITNVTNISTSLPQISPTTSSSSTIKHKPLPLFLLIEGVKV
ncbi:hypothetical protein RhiirA5_428734 [Rhizophagus irregularis]|uniref:Uncharacterized protein n=1 Tax=Rhizophagus irregularis TaxID=588596 RepID=A0A2N0R1G8_9GLOM|nr:hypothetical protein RhiirA5_428734 [Rhizophagus irregularis]PKC57147.1 hypothetical protein RhiirA1_472940 [Rhizophagus irregularis]